MQYEWWQAVSMFFAGVNILALGKGISRGDGPAECALSALGAACGLFAGWPP